MDKQEKNTSSVKDEKKACACDKDCACGCQEGKACCCCKCKKVWKILAVLVVFLAGMGFSQLLDCATCPKGPRPLANVRMQAPHQPMLGIPDSQGGNIIIINTDGARALPPFVGINHAKANHGKINHEGFKEDKGCPCAPNCTCGEGCPCTPDSCAKGCPCSPKVPAENLAKKLADRPLPVRGGKPLHAPEHK